MNTTRRVRASNSAVTGRLLLATLAGALFFLLPVPWDGSWTVPFDIVVSTITGRLPEVVKFYSLALIVSALVLTVAAHSPLGRRFAFVGKLPHLVDHDRAARRSRRS